MEDLETLEKNPPPPNPRLELLLDDLETLAKSNPLPPQTQTWRTLYRGLVCGYCLVVDCGKNVEPAKDQMIYRSWGCITKPTIKFEPISLIA